MQADVARIESGKYRGMRLGRVVCTAQAWQHLMFDKGRCFGMECAASLFLVGNVHTRMEGM